MTWASEPSELGNSVFLFRRQHALDERIIRWTRIMKTKTTGDGKQEYNDEYFDAEK